MCEIVIQDMCWPLLGSRTTPIRVARRSSGTSGVSRWVCGCVEARIPWTEGRSQGFTSSQRQRFAGDYQRGSLAGIYFLARVGSPNVTLVEVLQGGHNLESSLASERVATTRGDNDRKKIRYGVGVDGKREHQRFCEGQSA